MLFFDFYCCLIYWNNGDWKIVPHNVQHDCTVNVMSEHKRNVVSLKFDFFHKDCCKLNNDRLTVI